MPDVCFRKQTDEMEPQLSFDKASAKKFDKVIAVQGYTGDTWCCRIRVPPIAG
jgi:hypothetical protein